MKIDCIKSLMKQFPGVDAKIIRDFVEQAQSVRQGTATLEQFLELSGKELEDFSKEQLMFRKTLVDDFLKRQKALSVLTHKDFIKDPRKGFSAILYGEGFAPGSQESVAATKDAVLQKWHQMYEEEIVNNGLHNLLRPTLTEDLGNTRIGSLLQDKTKQMTVARAKLDFDVRQRMVDGVDKNLPLTNGKPDLTTHEGQVEHIANTFSKIYEDMRKTQNESGGFIAKYEGYAGRATHNADKLIDAVATLEEKGFKVPEEIKSITNPEKRSYEAWRNFYEPRLNLKETYARVGEDKEVFWREAYKDIVYDRFGKTVKEGKQEFNPDQKVAYNVITSISKGKRFIPLDGKSAAEYADVFGHGSVLDDLVQAMDRGAKTVGLLKLGSTPEDNLKALMTKMETVYQEMKFDPKTKQMGLDGIKAFDDGKKDIIDKFKSLAGQGGGASSNWEANVAKAMSYTRAFQVPRRLGSSIIRQLDDPVSSINLVSSATGQNILKTSAMWAEEFIKGLTSPSWVTKGLGQGPGHVEQMTAITKMAIDYTLSERIGPYEARDLPTGVLSKSIDLFFKANLMHWYGSLTKNATGVVMARVLAQELEKDFKDIHPAFRNTLESYGIMESHWNEMKGAVVEVGGDNKVFPKIKLLSIDKLNESPTSLLVRSYMNAPVELGTNMARDKERYLMYGDDPVNTIKGQIWREIRQFTGPFQAIKENVSRVYRADPTKINPFTKEQGDIGSLATYAGGLLAAATASSYLAAKLKRTVWDPTDATTMENIVTGTGLLGYQADRLLSEFERGEKLSPGAAFAKSTSLLGPTGQDIGMALALTTGKNKVSANQKAKFFSELVPGNNLWWLRAADGNRLKDAIQTYYDPQWKAKAELQKIREQRKKGF